MVLKKMKRKGCDKVKSINEIKGEVAVNVTESLIPEEGETITICGGLGDRTLLQQKKEEGVYYERSNEKDNWVEYNPHEQFLGYIRNVIRSCEEPPKKKSRLKWLFK